MAADYVVIPIPLPSLDIEPVGFGNTLDIGLSAQYASKNIIGCGQTIYIEITCIWLDAKILLDRIRRIADRLQIEMPTWLIDILILVDRKQRSIEHLTGSLRPPNQCLPTDDMDQTRYVGRQSKE